MSKEIINDIHGYMKFLEQSGYAVSFSFVRNCFAPYTHELLKYDFHPHGVCNYLKQNLETIGWCVANKRKLEQSNITKSYYGCCYAGVEEFLFPVRCDDKTILCIHVSGYRGRLDKSKRAMKKTSSFCTDRFLELYEELKDDVPDMERIAGFVNPLKYMMLELYKSCQSRKMEGELSSGNLYYKALWFIHENFSEPVNCEVLAKEMGYSPSYIRYIFKREGNISVQAKINEIRLNNAKRLLRCSDLSITEIAFSTGFSDSNYFSDFFKKHEKISPREYKKLVNDL